MLGLPGSGKGTQSRVLSDLLNLSLLATGDLFRKCIKKEDLGGSLAKIRDALSSGNLVGDDLVIDMVSDALSEIPVSKGIVFDGFPRNVLQAESLDRSMKVRGGQGVEVVVYLTASDKTVIERLAYRVVCEDCNRVYNMRFCPPSSAGICDSCGGSRLFTRSDDDGELIANRISIFKPEISKLLSYYSDRHLIEVSSEQGVSAISDEILGSMVKFSSNYT